MKENDIVKLTNYKSKYEINNLYKDVNGVVLKILPYNRSKVLFFNDKIVGDYAVVEVDNLDLTKENVKLPLEIITEIKTNENLHKKDFIEKQSFKVLKLNEGDMVELIVEDDKYAKDGIHKGDIGVIVIDYAVDNKILVDFSRVDEDENYYGDCISVRIKDLKKLN